MLVYITSHRAREPFVISLCTGLIQLLYCCTTGSWCIRAHHATPIAAVLPSLTTTRRNQITIANITPGVGCDKERTGRHTKQKRVHDRQHLGLTHARSSARDIHSQFTIFSRVSCSRARAASTEKRDGGRRNVSRKDQHHETWSLDLHFKRASTRKRLGVASRSTVNA